MQQARQLLPTGAAPCARERRQHSRALTFFAMSQLGFVSVQIARHVHRVSMDNIVCKHEITCNDLT